MTTFVLMSTLEWIQIYFIPLTQSLYCMNTFTFQKYSEKQHNAIWQEPYSWENWHLRKFIGWNKSIKTTNPINNLLTDIFLNSIKYKCLKENREFRAMIVKFKAALSWPLYVYFLNASYLFYIKLLHFDILIFETIEIN